MPRSSGTYTPPASSWNPTTSGASATKADWDALLADLAAAMTQSISRDGQSPVTANLPMASFKLTGLGAGTVAGDSARFEQVGALALAQGAAASGANIDITSLQGTATNNNAATGKIGEYQESELSSGSALGVILANSGTTNTPTGVSLSLTAGDWDVSFLAATSPSAGAVTQQAIAHLDVNSSGTYTIPNNGGVGFVIPPAIANIPIVLNGHKRFSLNATTTVYLRMRIDFTVNNMSIYGGIYARRVR